MRRAFPSRLPPQTSTGVLPRARDRGRRFRRVATCDAPRPPRRSTATGPPGLRRPRDGDDPDAAGGDKSELFGGICFNFLRVVVWFPFCQAKPTSTPGDGGTNPRSRDGASSDAKLIAASIFVFFRAARARRITVPILSTPTIGGQDDGGESVSQSFSSFLNHFLRDVPMFGTIRPFDYIRPRNVTSWSPLLKSATFPLRFSSSVPSGEGALRTFFLWHPVFCCLFRSPQNNVVHGDVAEVRAMLVPIGSDVGFLPADSTPKSEGR